MLSHKLLLENGGKTYLEKIKNLVDVNYYDLQRQINSTEYCSWYGTHLHCLCYLVGDIIKSYEDGVLITEFYGSQSKIDEETGILILKYLKVGGIDVNIKNYYEETAIECIKDKRQCLTSRINNSKFIEEVEKLYYKKTALDCVRELGVDI